MGCAPDSRPVARTLARVIPADPSCVVISCLALCRGVMAVLTQAILGCTPRPATSSTVQEAHPCLDDLLQSWLYKSLSPQLILLCSIVKLNYTLSLMLHGINHSYRCTLGL